LVDVKYLFYVIRSANFKFFGELSMSGAAGQKRVPSDFLKNHEIPLPPLETQKYIAAVLHKAEALKQKRQQALALADEYLRASFLDFFGDPITNPKGWPVHKILDLCSMDRETITPSERNGLPYLGLEHIESQTGKVLVDSKATIDHEVKGNSFYFNSGHILYGKLRPYLNKVALPTFEGISSTELVPLKANSEIANRYFVAEVLRSKTLVETVMNANQGARMPRTNMNFMLSLKVGLPPKPEQDKFEQIVKKVEALKAKMQTSQTDIEQLAKSLSQKAFRGELTGL
jgi:type I restriction enzyme S subunit